MSIAIPRDTVLAQWQKMDSRVLSAFSPSEEEIHRGESPWVDISQIVRDSVLGQISSGARFYRSYAGTPHGGEVKIKSVKNGREGTFLDALQFFNTTNGALNALYSAYEIPKYCRFWHALTGFDQNFILDNQDKHAVFHKFYAGRGTDMFLSVDSIVPGVHIHSLPNDMKLITCVAAYPNGDILECAVQTRHGKVIGTHKYVLLESGVQILY